MQTASGSTPATTGQLGPAIPSQNLKSSAPRASWQPTAGRPQNAAEHGSDSRPLRGAHDISPKQSSSEVTLRTGAEQGCHRQPAQKTVRSIADMVRCSHRL